jgi:hypothetical protein
MKVERMIILMIVLTVAAFVEANKGVREENEKQFYTTKCTYKTTEYHTPPIIVAQSTKANPNTSFWPPLLICRYN